MNLFLWTYLTLTVLDSIGRIIEIGKPREPRTANGVVCDLILNGLLTWGVIYYGGNQ